MAREFAQIIKASSLTNRGPKEDCLRMLGLSLTSETEAVADSPSNEYLSLRGGKVIAASAVPDVAPPATGSAPTPAKGAKSKAIGAIAALDFGMAAPRSNSLKVEVNGELVARVGAVFIQPEISAEKNHGRRFVLGFSRPVSPEEVDLPWLVRVRQSSTRARL